MPVPLNIKLGADALAYVIADAGCRAAAIEASAHPSAAVLTRDLPVRWAIGEAIDGFAPYTHVREGPDAAFTMPELPPEHPAFQPYTSGSTGKPKGVVLSHEGQMWWVRAVQRYWPNTPDGRALAAVPLYHKNAMAGAIKPMLHCGGSVVLLPDFEPTRFLRTLSGYRCTKAGAVPTVYTRLLQHPDLVETLDFSALNVLTVGSATVQEELFRRIEETFGCPVFETYGLTEGGPVMISSPPDGTPVPRGSCGVAWPEGEIKLIGPDGVPHESDGELWVRNPGVLKGYHNLPEVNARRLVDGWLATGDLFHRDADGFFYFRGRNDDMFKSSGESVYPKEVESLLIGHPQVYDACVIPLPDPAKGHVPVAMVMLREGEALDEGALKAWTIDNGPAYAHPRRIAFVDAMPLNGPRQGGPPAGRGGPHGRVRAKRLLPGLQHERDLRVSDTMDHTTLAALIDGCPFHRWLGLELAGFDADAGTVTIAMTLKPEMSRSDEGVELHGGITAALIDIAGDYAVAVKIGSGVPTIDLRVDYLKMGRGTRVEAFARAVRLGRSIGTVDIEVRDETGAVIAVGRGKYSTA